jgi:hypothetical protein
VACGKRNKHEDKRQSIHEVVYLDGTALRWLAMGHLNPFAPTNFLGGYLVVVGVYMGV